MPSALKKIVYKFLTPLGVFIFSALFALGLSTGSVYAGSGLVSSIGGATFIQGASHFWVTSAKPAFSGITTASGTVSGTVGSQSVSATADASGNWSWTPATDLSGDNAVSITSGATTVSFTLTIGALPESIASSSAGSLAPAGSTFPTLLFFGFGAAFILFGAFGLTKSFKSRN